MGSLRPPVVWLVLSIVAATPDLSRSDQSPATQDVGGSKSGAGSSVEQLKRKWRGQKGKQYDVLADKRNGAWYHGTVESVQDANESGGKSLDSAAADYRVCFTMDGWEALNLAHCVPASDEYIQPRGSKTVGKSSTGPNSEVSKQIKGIQDRDRATMEAGRKICAKFDGEMGSCLENSGSGCAWVTKASQGACIYRMKSSGWGSLVPFN